MASLLDAVHDISERLAALEKRIAKLYPKDPCEGGHDWTLWTLHAWKDGIRFRVCAQEDCVEGEYCGDEERPHVWCKDPEGKREGNTCSRCNENKV